MGLYDLISLFGLRSILLVGIIAFIYSLQFQALISPFSHYFCNFDTIPSQHLILQLFVKLIVHEYD
jgi:hypothetical protein